jgi:hypothetical protein
VVFRPQGGGRAVGDADAAEDVAGVHLDGGLGDAQAAGDLLVRQAGADQPQDLLPLLL